MRNYIVLYHKDLSSSGDSTRSNPNDDLFVQFCEYLQKNNKSVINRNTFDETIKKIEDESELDHARVASKRENREFFDKLQKLLPQLQTLQRSAAFSLDDDDGLTSMFDRLLVDRAARVAPSVKTSTDGTSAAGTSSDFPLDDKITKKRRV